MYDLSTSGHIDAKEAPVFYSQRRHTEGEYRHITEEFCIFDTFAMHGALRQDGFDNLVKEVKQVIGSRPVWISFDVDAFDAAMLPPRPFQCTMAPHLKRWQLCFSSYQQRFECCRWGGG